MDADVQQIPGVTRTVTKRSPITNCIARDRNLLRLYPEEHAEAAADRTAAGMETAAPDSERGPGVVSAPGGRGRRRRCAAAAWGAAGASGRAPPPPHPRSPCSGWPGEPARCAAPSATGSSPLQGVSPITDRAGATSRAAAEVDGVHGHARVLDSIDRFRSRRSLDSLPQEIVDALHWTQIPGAWIDVKQWYCLLTTVFQFEAVSTT